MTIFLDQAPDLLLAADHANTMFQAAVSIGNGGAQDGATAFLNSEIGQSIDNLLGALAIIVVIATIVLSIGPAMKGKVGGALKVIAIGFLIAGILWKPEMFTSGIGAMADLWDKILNSFSDVTG